MRKTKDGDDKTIKFYNVVNTTISVGLRPRTIPYQVIFMFTIQTGNIKVSMVRLNGKAANSAWRAALAVALAVMMSMLTIACSPSPLQEKLEMTGEQLRDLEKYLLAETGIVLVDAVPSENPIVEDIGEGFLAYDVQTYGGQNCLLIIGDENKSFVAILDENDSMINGLIDRGVLPTYFAEHYD